MLRTLLKLQSRRGLRTSMYYRTELINNLEQNEIVTCPCCHKYTNLENMGGCKRCQEGGDYDHARAELHARYLIGRHMPANVMREFRAAGLQTIESDADAAHYVVPPVSNLVAPKGTSASPLMSKAASDKVAEIKSFKMHCVQCGPSMNLNDIRSCEKCGPEASVKSQQHDVEFDWFGGQRISATWWEAIIIVLVTAALMIYLLINWKLFLIFTLLYLYCMVGFIMLLVVLATEVVRRMLGALKWANDGIVDFCEWAFRHITWLLNWVDYEFKKQKIGSKK